MDKSSRSLDLTTKHVWIFSFVSAVSTKSIRLIHFINLSSDSRFKFFEIQSSVFVYILFFHPSRSLKQIMMNNLNLCKMHINVTSLIPNFWSNNLAAILASCIKIFLILKVFSMTSFYRSWYASTLVNIYNSKDFFELRIRCSILLDKNIYKIFSIFKCYTFGFFLHPTCSSWSINCSNWLKLTVSLPSLKWSSIIILTLLFSSMSGFKTFRASTASFNNMKPVSTSSNWQNSS